MGWKETCAVEERMKFVLACGQGDEAMAATCRQFGVSCRVGYKWLGRYRELGVAGLLDRSRAAHRHPNEVAGKVQEAVLELRSQHPTWGPRKLLAVLERKRPGIAWPSGSTVGSWLASHGLSVPRKHRRRVALGVAASAGCRLPNDLWCIDFKGWFVTGDGKRCDPLTLTDAMSRRVLRCQVMPETTGRAVRPVLEAAFREFGLPLAIRSDNGPPFASRAIAGLSPLSVWWTKLGIAHDRIRPGCPQENGRHERMHLTLKQETANPPAANGRRQQERFAVFMREFNGERPHEALGMATPDSCYRASPRPYPAREPEVEYPRGWQVRRGQRNGEFFWKHQPVFLSEVLGGQAIGLEPVDERYWRAWFGPVALGVFDSRAPRMLSSVERRRWEHRRAASLAEAPVAALQGLLPANPLDQEVLPMCPD